MKTYGEWEHDFFRDNPNNRDLSREVLRAKFNKYIEQDLLGELGETRSKQKEKYSERTKSTNNKLSKEGFSSLERKLDKLYDVLNHIRWIGLGIGGMFAMTFIIPQCIGN